MEMRYCNKPGCGRGHDLDDPTDPLPICGACDCAFWGVLARSPVEVDPKPEPEQPATVRRSTNPRVTVHFPPSADAEALTVLLGEVRDVLDAALPKGRAASIAHEKLDELGMWSAAALNTPEEFQS